MSDGHDDVTIEPEGDEGTGTSAQKMKKLREERDSARKERDEYLAGWQRSKADYVNLSKRAREGSEELTKNAISSVAHGIVGVFDSLEAAQNEAHEAPEGLRKGIEQVSQQLESVLKDHGVIRFQPEAGDEFDPERHEPVQTVACNKESEDNTIEETLQSGFEVNGNVIRPARVSVRKIN